MQLTVYLLKAIVETDTQTVAINLKSHRNLTVYNLQIIFKHKVAPVNCFQLMIYQFHLKLSRRSQLSVETVVDGKTLHRGFGFF